MMLVVIMNSRHLRVQASGLHTSTWGFVWQSCARRRMLAFQARSPPVLSEPLAALTRCLPAQCPEQLPSRCISGQAGVAGLMVCARTPYVAHHLLLCSLLEHRGLGKQSKWQGSEMELGGCPRDCINKCFSMEQMVWCSLGAAACRCACMLMVIAVKELHSCIMTALAGKVWAYVCVMCQQATCIGAPQRAKCCSKLLAPGI